MTCDSKINSLTVVILDRRQGCRTQLCKWTTWE